MSRGFDHNQTLGSDFLVNSVSVEGYRNQIQSEDNDPSNRRNQEDPTTLTYQLVNELKRKIEQYQNKSNGINESFIEREVVRIRKERNKELDVSKWKENLPEDLRKCRDEIIHQSMAYGNNINEVRTVLQAKVNSMKTPTENSLNETFEPLKRLLKKLQNTTPVNLFDAVLNVTDDDIDRADRMFYSEARQLLNDPKNYTYKTAHDQVLAIRLMNFSSDDSRELSALINHHQNFNDAYSYLQKLTRERSKPVKTPSTNENRPGSSNKSIVAKDVNANTTTTNNYYAASAYDHNYNTNVQHASSTSAANNGQYSSGSSYNNSYYKGDSGDNYGRRN